jgi:hypothetical protein
MKNSFWGVLWSSFNAINGWFLGTSGIFIGVLLIRFPFNTPVPLDVVLIIGFFTLLAFLILINALNTSLQEYKKLKRRNIPSILFIQKEPNTSSVICLLEYSELFAHDMMVSAYYTNASGFEVLVAVGFIKNIQSDGKIQIILDQPIPSYQDIFEQLVSNNKSIIDKTIIKPGISKEILNNFIVTTLFNQP